MNFDLSLYLVTDRTLLHGRDLVKTVEQAVQAGVTMVQLREKDCSTACFVALAEALRHALRPYNVPLIINDRIDVALAVDADGVHIGQSDMPYETARRLLGHDKIIGLSVENLQQVKEANGLDVDYIGISPVFATDTKTDTARPFGLDGLREALSVSEHPTVAIGGMNERTIPEVMDCGVDGVALVSAIIASNDVCSATRRLRSLVPDKKNRRV
ncbi:MAG: thiamine phosphate synthase [Bacteroidales bacterium]|nr:thiamine phosphate synthase [Bacteroidales bacterium]